MEPLGIGLSWKTKKSLSISGHDHSVSSQARCVSAVIFSWQKEWALQKFSCPLWTWCLSASERKGLPSQEPRGSISQSSWTVSAAHHRHWRLSAAADHRQKSHVPMAESDSRCCLWDRGDLVKRLPQKRTWIYKRFSVYLYILGEKSWDFCILCPSNSVMLL